MNDENSLYFTDLTQRALNVCAANKLSSLDAVVDYYKLNNNFLGLKNCGAKSNKELIDLCKETIKETYEEKLEIINIKNLSRLQRNIINDFINITLKNLSNRSKNALVLILNNDFNIETIQSKVFENGDFKIESVRNVGYLTVVELNDYFKNIELFLKEVHKLTNEEELRKLKLKFYINRAFDLENLPESLLSTQSLFKIVNFMIDGEILFQDAKTTVLKKYFTLYENNYDEKVKYLAIEGFTRERVRQMRLEILSDMSIKISLLSSLKEMMAENSHIDFTQSFIIINNSLSQHINQISDTNFSKQFITFVIGHLLSSDFSIIGNQQDALLVKFSASKNRHNWKSLYLLEKRLSQKVNIDSLFNDIDHRISLKIEETYKFNLKSYIAKFSSDLTFAEIEILSSFVEEILHEELGLFLDINDQIIFQRNTIKILPEYVEEILEELNKPSTLNEIFHALNEKHPNLTRSQTSLRGTCQRMDNLIYFGRSSTYGLKKWEQQDDFIKGGTIKDMVLQFLETHNKPMHIFEILEYVNQYRDTNWKSILNNLIIDPTKSCKFYVQGFIGLKSKINLYDEEKYNLLPKQLGKTIIFLVRAGTVNNETELINYISLKHNLENNESRAIIHKLQLTTKLFK